MVDAAIDPLDEHLRERWQAGEHAATATLWLDRLGPEIHSFLAAMPIAGVEVDDVFAMFCEALWKSLPGFRWECAARTWSYRLARASWQRALDRSRRGAFVPLSGISELSGVIERVRTSTAAFQRTEVKDEFRALREQLPPDDRMLLILRVDRGLDWLDAARVLAPEGAEDPAALATASARLRKQFQRVKTRIRELARARGLLDGT